MIKNRFLKRRSEMERSRNQMFERQIKQKSRPVSKQTDGPFLCAQEGNMSIIFDLYRHKKNLEDEGGWKGLYEVKLTNPGPYEPKHVDLGNEIPSIIDIKPDPDHKGRVIILAYGEIKEHITD